jgi:CRP-like cAMP-binding protein
MEKEKEFLYISEGQKNIYLIDNDIELLKKIGNIMVNQYPHYQIIASDNLEDAKYEVDQHRPSVVVISLEMAGEDSLEFVRQLRGHHLTAKTPIIVMANRGFLEKNASILEKLKVEFVPKAIRIPYLMGVLNNCLQRSNSIDVEIINLKPGELLFREGDESTSVFILKTGRLLVYKQDRKDIFKLAQLEGTQMIGEMAFLDGSRRTASIKAIDESQVVKLSLGNVDELIAGQPFWMGMMLKTLIDRLKEANEKVIKLSQSS